MPRLPLLVGCCLAAGLLSRAGPALASEDEDQVRAFLRKRFSGTGSRPVRKASDVVKVTVGLTDVFLEIDDEKSYKTAVSGWLLVEWTDYRLDWSTQPLLNRTNSIRLNSLGSKVWTPNIQVINAIVKMRTLFSFAEGAVVSRNGTVSGLVPVRFEAPLKAPGILIDGIGSPAICSFTLGSMLTSLDVVDFRPLSKTISPVDMSRRRKVIEASMYRGEMVRNSKHFATLGVRISFNW